MADESTMTERGRRVRLVATDMDGTFLGPDGTVSARTAKAVRAARAAGIYVVPATARPPQALWELAAAGGLGPLGVCSNGAALVDIEHTAVLEVHGVPGGDAIELVTAIRTVVGGVHFAVDRLDCFTHEPAFFDIAPAWEEPVNRIDDIRLTLELGTISLIARRPGWSAMELMVELGPVVAGRLALTTAGLDWVHLAPPAVSKAARLETLCTHLGVHSSEVIAVGDHHNDLPMLAWAGTAMAVANAVPDVLAAVDRTLPSNEDHGVATLLEELVETAS